MVFDPTIVYTGPQITFSALNADPTKSSPVGVAVTDVGGNQPSCS